MFKTDSYLTCWKQQTGYDYILRLTQYAGNKRNDYWVKLFPLATPGGVIKHYKFTFVVVAPPIANNNEIPLDLEVFNGEWQARVYARKNTLPDPPIPFPDDYNFGTLLFFEGAQKLGTLIV